MSSFINVAVFLGLFVTSASPENVCSNRECKNIAEKYLSNMDSFVDPCEDFYKFACSKFAANNPRRKDQHTVAGYTILRDLVDKQLMEELSKPIKEDEAKHLQNYKKYYNSCMKIDKIEEIGLDEVKKILETLGGWPVVEDTNPDVGWESVLYNINKNNLNSYNLIDLQVITDLKNSTSRILHITPPDFKKFDQVNFYKLKSYYDSMVQIAMKFGAKEDTAKIDIALITTFEIKLITKAKSDLEKIADPEACNNLYSIKQLEREFPGFPWSDFLENFTPKSLNIDDNTKMVLTQPEYTKYLIEILKATPIRVIRNYLISKAIWFIAPFLNKEVRKFGPDKYQHILRSKECLDLTNEDCEGTVNALYVRKYFNQESKTIVSKLATYIREVFAQTLNETMWPEQDKAKAIEKLQNMDVVIGFRNELLDDEKLNSFYKNLEFSENSFLQNRLNLIKFQRELEFNGLYRPVNRTNWFDFQTDMVDVNSFYFADTNSYEISAAILQGNYFNANFPQSINFGAIGHVIGHEISHAFDNGRRKYNKNGDFQNWWSIEAEQDFAGKVQCLNNQFNNFKIMGKKVNGNIKLAENIADLAAVKTSYLAYQNWKLQHNDELGLPNLNYTNNQLFWIAFANVYCINQEKGTTLYYLENDAHSPENFRVNGPLSNLEMFSKDFNCPVGSNMNPEMKCTLW